MIAETGQQGEPEPGAYAAALFMQSRAHLRLAQRRPAAALVDATAAGARWEELAVRHPGVASWRVDAAEALVALGEGARARGLAHEHVALAERAEVAGPHGAALRVLALTAGREERIDLLDQARRRLADSPAQLEHARVLVELGAALRVGLDLAEREGMDLMAGRARAELRAAGAKPRRSALSGPAALTPAEHRVATLAADGHSNREIAEQLYVTERTVETHLTHAFRKLDLSGRDGLRASLYGRAGALA